MNDDLWVGEWVKSFDDLLPQFQVRAEQDIRRLRDLRGFAFEESAVTMLTQTLYEFKKYPKHSSPAVVVANWLLGECDRRDDAAGRPRETFGRLMRKVD